MMGQKAKGCHLKILIASKAAAYHRTRSSENNCPRASVFRRPWYSHHPQTDGL